jgi:hypothetical protein
MRDVGKSTAERSGTGEGDPSDGRRRDALRRLARYGAFTAPALLVMLQSEKATAVSLPR